MVVAMTAIVTLTAIFTYRHVAVPPAFTKPPTKAPVTQSAPTTATSEPQAAMAADFMRLQSTLHAKMGIAVRPIGSGGTATEWGDWQEGPAWSTIKVPLVIAAYRQHQPQRVTDTMKAAITESDNAAAESLWQQLGDPTTAAQAVQQILQQAGDPTTVESRKLRPEFTAFGQTIWSLTNQVRFIASAFCDGDNGPIFDLMSQIEPDQKWGIGGMPGIQFKGGWGPSTSGKYLVRQTGILNTASGNVAVAVAAEPSSGSFDDGIKDLNEVANWLTDHLDALPAAQCSR